MFGCWFAFHSQPQGKLRLTNDLQASAFKQCVTLSTQNAGKAIFLWGRIDIKRECVKASIKQELSSFFFFNINLFKLEANYNIVVVLPYFDMDPPQVYMCSPFRTPLPLPSLSHSSGSSQCTSLKHLVSCIEPGLAIYFTYDNIHVSMPFSQIIPPLPSPTESKRLFYTPVSLLLSRL